METKLNGKKINKSLVNKKNNKYIQQQLKLNQN